MQTIAGRAGLVAEMDAIELGGDPQDNTAHKLVRGCADLNIVGGDLVEVSPPFDPSGNTALIGANLLYEMLCILPGVMRAAV